MLGKLIRWVMTADSRWLRDIWARGLREYRGNDDNIGLKYRGNCGDGDGDGFCGNTAAAGSSFREITAVVVSLLMTDSRAIFLYNVVYQ